jgi:hypothetical protein
MFYKALGFAVWKLGLAYIRRRYARQAKIVAGLAVISIVAAGYLATRSGS